MAKNAKNSSANGKPITEFFTRSSKTPASQGVPSTPEETKMKTSSQAKGITRGSGRAQDPVNKSSPLGNTSKSSAKQESNATAETVTPARRSGTSSGSNVHLAPPVSVGSLKRSRSPEPSRRSVTPNERGAQSTSSKLPNDRLRSKFESETEAENIPDCVYVVSKLGPQTKKKARLSSPTMNSPSEVPTIIPSSQSDEEDLSSREIEPRIQKVPANKTANRTSSVPVEREEDVHMKTDDELLDDLGSPLPSFSSDVENRRPDQAVSYSPSSLASTPLTPAALDQDSKTAKIIAEIKERAYAKVLSSPETLPLDFDDKADSSSDEENILPVRPTASRKPANGQQTSVVTTRRSSRNTLTTRSPSPSMGSNRLTSFSSPHKTHRPEKRKADPFAALLREKKMTVKNGIDESAIQRAEMTAQQLTRNGLLSEIDREDNENGWNEDAAQLVAQDPQSFIAALKTPDRSSSPGYSGEETRKNLFGKRNGKGVLDILRQDSAVKRHDELAEKRSGIQFWSYSQAADITAMQVDETTSPYQLPGTSMIISLLNASLRRHDLTRAAILLDSYFISSVSFGERTAIVSSLYDLAFSVSARYMKIRESAFRALEYFWASPIEPQTSSASISQVLKTIRSLGADQSILYSLGWTVDDAMQAQDVSAAHRNDFIQHLLILVDCCASSRRIPMEEASDIILALLLVGMDLGTPRDILRDITHTLDLLGRCISPDGSISLQTEFTLCFRILKCAHTYSPINQVRLISLLSGGSGPIRRVANFVAYCVVNYKSQPELQIYSDTPPLLDVVGQLVPYSKSNPSGPGKFAVHDQTDYVDLGFHIIILGIAVSNLRSYANQERRPQNQRQSSSTHPEGMAKTGEKLKTDLQLLHGALEQLHSSIADTRATHLERSRTKAIIKGLAMNIHYQRDSWLKNDVNHKAKTLAQYFTKRIPDTGTQ